MQYSRCFLVMFITVLIGYMLTIWPLFPVLKPWRPQWLLVIVLFWSYLKPEYFGVVMACLIGLILDLLVGTPLGTYGLIFTLLIYLFRVFITHFRFCSIFKQALWIGAFTFLSVILRIWLMAIARLPNLTSIYLLSSISSMLVWPVLCFIFKNDLNRLQFDISSSYLEV